MNLYIFYKHYDHENDVRSIPSCKYNFLINATLWNNLVSFYDLRWDNILTRIGLKLTEIHPMHYASEHPWQ